MCHHHDVAAYYFYYLLLRVEEMEDDSKMMYVRACVRVYCTKSSNAYRNCCLFLHNNMMNNSNKEFQYNINIIHQEVYLYCTCNDMQYSIVLLVVLLAAVLY